MSVNTFSTKTVPIPVSKYNDFSIINQYRKFNITDINETIDSKFNKSDKADEKLSESSNFPNFPPGTTPPDDQFMRLVYLNYLANKSIVNSIDKFD